MAKIRLLSKSVSELIAAGEVIERPASVIKELIENSIDAGADTVTVEIKNGGISFIRITDNGCGIPMLDMPLAFERHATSKIETETDLENIMTLGFRGEALASIAAVSKVEMTSKTKDEQFGGKFTIEGSEPLELEEVGCADGTSIVIRDIFYNTPARLKFLKSSSTEGNYIANLVDKIALSHPEVSFRFIKDGKQELCTTGNGDLYSAIFSVFGPEFSKSLMPVDYSMNGIEVKGYVNIPEKSKNNRTMQNWFVNGRYVRAGVLTVSLEEAFKNAIMIGKFPACVLMLKINPSLLDVNVHPTKTEVKFSNDKAVYEAIYFAVKNAILNYSKKDTIEAATPSKTEYIPKNKPIEKTEKPEKIEYISSPVKTEVKTYEPKGEVLTLNQNTTEYKLDNQPKIQTQVTEIKAEIKPKTIAEEFSKKIEENFSFITANSFEEHKEQPAENTVIEGIEKVTETYRIVGEIFKTYIVVETESDVALIDKHAVHERYIFEQIKSGKMKSAGQVLMFPMSVTLTRNQVEALMSQTDLINELGFVFSKVSDTEISVTEIPTVLEESVCEGVLNELADNILSNKNDITPAVLDLLYATISCKSAIKGHDDNNETELKEVVDMVFSNENLRYCPHGRPTITHLKKRHFEKMFGRTGQ